MTGEVFKGVAASKEDVQIIFVHLAFENFEIEKTYRKYLCRQRPNLCGVLRSPWDEAPTQAVQPREKLLCASLGCRTFYILSRAFQHSCHYLDSPRIYALKQSVNPLRQSNLLPPCRCCSEVAQGSSRNFTSVLVGGMDSKNLEKSDVSASSDGGSHTSGAP